MTTTNEWELENIWKAVQELERMLVDELGMLRCRRSMDLMPTASDDDRFVEAISKCEEIQDMIEFQS